MRRARSTSSNAEEQQPPATATTAVVSKTPSQQPCRKRRRTMVEAFQSLSIQHGETGTDDVDTHSSWATGGGESMLEDDSTTSSSSSTEMLTEEEAAAKKVMYQLVMGEDERPKDPVEAKLQDLIRQSRLKAESQQMSKDDFDIKTAYGTTASAMKQDSSMEAPGHVRSSSLPQDWMESIMDSTTKTTSSADDMML